MVPLAPLFSFNTLCVILASLTEALVTNTPGVIRISSHTNGGAVAVRTIRGTRGNAEHS